MELGQKLTEAMKSNLKAALDAGYPLELPPKSFTEMSARPEAYDEELKSLTVSFPFDPRFTNPMGMLQGGMFCTALDNTFGPLSFLVCENPSVTLDLSTSYFRPFFKKDERMIVTAKVVSQTAQIIYMEAEIRNPKGSLLAQAQTKSFVLSPQAIAKSLGR